MTPLRCFLSSHRLHVVNGAANIVICNENITALLDSMYSWMKEAIYIPVELVELVELLTAVWIKGNRVTLSESTTTRVFASETN